MSKLAAITGAVLLSSLGLVAQPPTVDKGSHAHPGIPRLDELFGEISTVFSSIDGGQAAIFKARLRETDEELRLLESLKGTLDKGIMMEIPASLRPRMLPDASKLRADEEQRLVDELSAELKLRELRQRDRLHRPRSLLSKEASAMGMALMDVIVELPEPPNSAMGSKEKVAQAADPLGVAKSLFLAADYVGALNAYQSIPDEKHTVETRYRLARIHEKLGRWKNAKEGYETVARLDPKGHWGDSARWMLRFAKHQRVVFGVLSKKGGEKTK